MKILARRVVRIQVFAWTAMLIEVHKALKAKKPKAAEVNVTRVPAFLDPENYKGE